MTPGAWARLAGTLAVAIAIYAALPRGHAAGVDVLDAAPFPLSTVAADGDTFMGIRLLGTLELVSPPGHPDRVHSLSGLGWDEDDERLYAQSDRGELLHLRPRFEAGRLTGVTLLARFFLRGEDGKRLRRGWADAEGLVVLQGRNAVPGDASLLVSFERHPRIAEFSTDGRFIRSHPLPERFADRATYADPNQALEAIAWDPVHGAVTGPERPLAGGPYGEVPLVGRAGVLATYPLSGTPNSSLVALERLPDGRFLALERGYGLLKLPLEITLKRTAALPARPSAAYLDTATVAVLNSSRGWSVDNFEGLARHHARRFFMVSDNNDRSYQRTLLTYFEVLEGDVPAGTEYDTTPIPER